MGSSQSAQSRRISIENDDPASVIKVSDSVVQRLKGAADNKGSPTSPQAQQTVRQSEPSTEQIVPGGYFPTKTSVEIRQEQEAALQNNDEYWERRLKIMEEGHKRMNAKLEEEYNKAVKEVEELFAGSPAARDNQCDAAEESVKKCYLDNPKEVLKCSREVEAFAACVDMKRIDILDSRQ